jgi:hypothetical protein
VRRKEEKQHDSIARLPDDETRTQSRGTMYATIRRYTPKPGTVDKKAWDDLGRRIEKGFVPKVQDVRGFHCYYTINVDNKELITIGLFDDKAGATESTRRAAEFVKTDPLKDQLGAPQISEGELLVMREAAVAAH